MSYVDGFVAAVPTANREAYRAHAARTAAVFKEHGALSCIECWGDDVPDGEVTSFPMAVKRQPDETVVFSWIAWPSKQARDAAWAKVMADPRMQPDVEPMPFDGMRLIYGGFEPILDQGAGGATRYVDGYLLAVPEANREAYRTLAAESADMFAGLGALRTVEAWGDDVPDGKVTDFRRAVKAKDGEAVLFSWVEWPDKDTRAAAWKRFAEESPMTGEPPFDGKRMIYGGFETIVEA